MFFCNFFSSLSFISIEGHYLNIVANSSVREEIRNCFRAANVTIADLPITVLALADSMLTESEKRSGCVFVDMGAETTSVAIFKNNLLRHLAVIPLGGANINRDITSLQVEDDEGHLPDGTDVRAAIGVLQRIGVTTVLISAHDPESLTQALEIAAPYARLSLGVCMHADWLSQTTLYNTEVIVPDITEAFVAALRGNQVACETLPRDHDDFICAPDGKHAHFIAPTIDISDEIECGPHLDEDLIEAEDDSGAFKLLLETEEDVVTLEESRYMISRPLCLCAESADLLEQGLRVFPGLALYDGTWEQEDTVISYFETKYGMIRL